MRVINYDRKKFDVKGINLLTGTKYDPQGYDMYGFNEQGVHKDTGTYFDIYGYDKDGYDREGYDSNGYDRRGYDKEGYDANKVDELGMSKKTGTKDKRVELAEKFIKSGLTFEEFCKAEEKSADNVKATFDTIIKSPCIKADLEKALKEGYSQEAVAIKEQLLSGKKTIVDVGCIDNIIYCATAEERQTIREMVIKAAKSHEVKILQYRTMFGIEATGKELPQRIADRLGTFTSFINKSKDPEVRMAKRHLDAEYTRVLSYRSPFKEGDLKRIGWIKDGKEQYIEISQKRIEKAKKYLEENGEFVCYKTMHDLFQGILKGTFDKRKAKMIINDEEEPEK